MTLAFVVTLKSNVTLKLLITNQYDLFFSTKIKDFRENKIFKYFNIPPLSGN